MREFYIHQGKYEGTHNIYDSIEEFKEKTNDLPFKRWQREPIEAYEIGDWVQVNDGYIVQILNITQSQNGTYFVRFPMRTVAIVLYKDKVYWQKVLGQTAPINSSRASGKNYKSKKVYMAKKTAFVSYLKVGYPYWEAYKKAGFQDKMNVKSKAKYMHDLGALMLDPDVQEMLTQEAAEYVEKLRKDDYFSDENMIKLVKEFMTHVRKGSQVHLNSLVPLLQLAGKIK